MPLSYQTGDLFTSNAHVLVNPVNCVGVMGKGLARQFKERCPFAVSSYRAMCKTGYLRIGNPRLWVTATPWILLFPTKVHWRGPSQLHDIEQGLEGFTTLYRFTQRKGVEITSIAFPKLGCGEGGLSWTEVKPLMERFLCPLALEGLQVSIYE